MKRIIIIGMLVILPAMFVPKASAGNSEKFYLKATIPVIVGVNAPAEEPLAEEAKAKQSIKPITEEVLRNDRRIVLVTLVDD